MTLQIKAFLVLYTITAVLLLLPTNAKATACKENAEWRACGSACPPSCSQPSANICTFNCVIGCQCKVGYLLNGNGDCVLPADC